MNERFPGGAGDFRFRSSARGFYPGWSERCSGALRDEPTTSLDPAASDELLSILMEDHAPEGRTIFISSHQLSEIERVCDWVGIIDEGRLMEARIDEIRAEYRVITAAGRDLPPAERRSGVLAASRAGNFVRYLVASEAERFRAELVRQGTVVSDVSNATLREVFLEMVRKEELCTSGSAGAIPALASTSI